jgi:hypothetical protein
VKVLSVFAVSYGAVLLPDLEETMPWQYRKCFRSRDLISVPEVEVIVTADDMSELHDYNNLTTISMEMNPS